MIHAFVRVPTVRTPAVRATLSAALCADISRLTRRWIATGNQEQPLTCVWVAACESSESIHETMDEENGQAPLTAATERNHCHHERRSPLRPKSRDTRFLSATKGNRRFLDSHSTNTRSK